MVAAYVSGADDPVRMFAMGLWLLPRVPTVGEEVVAGGHRHKIERVTWDSSGRALVRLRERSAEPEQLEELEQEGWHVTTWEEAEPPSNWLTE